MIDFDYFIDYMETYRGSCYLGYEPLGEREHLHANGWISFRTRGILEAAGCLDHC